MRHSTRRARRGNLATVLLLCCLLLILGLTFATRVGGERRLTGHEVDRSHATALAEAAVEESVAALIHASRNPDQPLLDRLCKDVSVPSTRVDVPLTHAADLAAQCGSATGNPSGVAAAWTVVERFPADDNGYTGYKEVYAGTLELEGVAKVGKTTWRVRAGRDYRVCPLIPPPLDRYSAWSTADGALAAPAILGDGQGSLTPPPAQDRSLVDAWRFHWKNESPDAEPGYPFDRRAVSILAPPTGAPPAGPALEFSGASVPIDGVVAMASSQAAPLRVTGALHGRGMIVVRRGNADVSGCSQGQDDVAGVVLLGQLADLRVDGPFRGFLAAPQGTIHLDSGARILGTVYAAHLDRASGATVQPLPAIPAPLVTVSGPTTYYLEGP